MNNQLVTFVGFKSSGKNTAAQPLIDEFGYAPLSFADAMKDSLASIFCWSRIMLEGITQESREWREQIDQWWADRLGIPEFSPRWAMRHFGTEIMRAHFNPEIWVLNVERRIMMLGDRPVVIIDARFPNEIELARRFGGRVARIKRGSDPNWMPMVQSAPHQSARDVMTSLDIHESEWAWIGTPVDVTIENDRSIADLRNALVGWLGLETAQQPA
jgi:hypothetical protein